jgi:hypothetical protein
VSGTKEAGQVGVDMIPVLVDGDGEEFMFAWDEAPWAFYRRAEQHLAGDPELPQALAYIAMMPFRRLPGGELTSLDTIARETDKGISAVVTSHAYLAQLGVVSWDEQRQGVSCAMTPADVPEFARTLPGRSQVTDPGLPPEPGNVTATSSRRDS